MGKGRIIDVRLLVIGEDDPGPLGACGSGCHIGRTLVAVALVGAMRKKWWPVRRVRFDSVRVSTCSCSVRVCC